MFFYHTVNQRQEEIVLHVRGFINEEGQGFVNDEGIFLVESRSANNLEVTEQVGHVSIMENKLSFVYTSQDFKDSIGYQEETGYSCMDGGLWRMINVRYTSPEGNPERTMQPRSLPMTMYTSAKNPFNQTVGAALRLFGAFQTRVRNSVNPVIEENVRNSTNNP